MSRPQIVQDADDVPDGAILVVPPDDPDGMPEVRVGKGGTWPSIADALSYAADEIEWLLREGLL